MANLVLTDPLELAALQSAVFDRRDTLREIVSSLEGRLDVTRKQLEASEAECSDLRARILKNHPEVKDEDLASVELVPGEPKA